MAIFLFLLSLLFLDGRKVYVAVQEKLDISMLKKSPKKGKKENAK